MTEPSRITFIFMVGLVSFFYMFSLFRQCYTIWDNTNEDDFNYKALVLSGCCGSLPIIGSLALINYALLWSLPITASSYQLTENLEATVQIVIVVFGFMLTYRVFTTSDVTKFMRALTRKYRKKDGSNSDVEALGDNVEAGGAMIREYIMLKAHPTDYGSIEGGGKPPPPSVPPPPPHEKASSCSVCATERGPQSVRNSLTFVSEQLYKNAACSPPQWHTSY